MNVEHVAGKKKGKVMLYALSTCGWCRRTRELLESIGVEYDYIYVDKLRGKEQEEVLREVARHNPSGNFPTLMVDDKCIIGFREDEIREVLEK